MKRKRHALTTWLVTAAATGSSLGASGEAPAGCPCQGGGVSASAPLMTPTVASPLPAYGSQPWNEMGAEAAALAGQTIQPPPGTVGRTYQIESRPIPAKMHPRVAMADVRVANASAVLVHDMNPNRMEDRLDGFQDVADPCVWHFQTEPLIPGLPQIYRIEATIVGDDCPRMEERYVRLIMGRLIEVEF